MVGNQFVNVAEASEDASMRFPVMTRWLRLRAVFAVVILVLVIEELVGPRVWPAVLVQVIGIIGVVITSALDVHDIRRKRLNR